MQEGSTAARLMAIADTLSRSCDAAVPGDAAAYVYNPLDYARAGFAEYVGRYSGLGAEAVLVGMNPGPFGMAQTGVPFGHVGLVRDWMGIEVPIGRPAREHPKRPVEGFACRRSEVSGARLWGWARERYGTPQRFFRRFFVLNWCPLAFVEESGRNLTPDRLGATVKKDLAEACDRALAASLGVLAPRLAIGVGAFAASRVAPLARDLGIDCGTVPHPSPASPAANRGWSEAAEAALLRLGIELP